ncbi:hypothetical protein NLM59_06455 [Weeksellaceae bacterium KMM 9724]|uniref:hypothetical protein n=1 Tax=Profundicola chukchiensis TaxID=2961959 RepID=UPI0024397E34|nr:hypothetical protein [Profundicola chukchiensis]MDG4950558.1 hypothetical protein [Profundicola chukchiensis]
MRAIVIILLANLMLMSCSTVKTGTSKTMDIVGAGVIHKPVIADLVVNDTKVSKTATFTKLESLESAKNNVVRELLKEKNADVLVEPTFESTTTNNKTELTVYGWTATYKNFRQMEESDIKYLEVQPSYLQKAENNQPTILTSNNKGGLGKILIPIGVVTLGLILGAAL